MSQPFIGASSFQMMVLRRTGWTEILMHPVPRGIPILETAAEVTGEIYRGRDYIEKLIV